MRRIFWMAVGAGATVWAMNKANEAVHRLTPDSLSGTAARSALHLGDAARRFATDVKDGMAEREQQLREDLGLAGTAVLEPARGRSRVRTDEVQYRAISAAPGTPAAALPPSSRRSPTTAKALAPKPTEQQLLRGGTPNRKDQ